MVKSKNNFKERGLWFASMVGKKIYRRDNRCIDCKCKPSCVCSVEVLSEGHAAFLHDMEVTDQRVVYFDNKRLEA